MNTQQNIIERLQDAANIMHEHAQYNDEEHNGEGIAAQTCEDAAKIISDLLSALQRAEAALSWFINDEGECDIEALEEVQASIAKAEGEIK
jgi:hypothetical protein